MPFGDEALHYVKLSFLQRDVIVNISSVDRTGAYLGTVQVDKQTVDGSPVDIGLNLLENGYATLNEFFDPSRDDGGENYVRAQVAAKAADKGLWKELNPLEVAAAAKETKERGDDGKVSEACNGFGCEADCDRDHFGRTEPILVIRVFLYLLCAGRARKSRGAWIWWTPFHPQRTRYRRIAA